MIFDTHAHYDDEQFDGDRDELLKSMPDLGVGTIVDVSATYESCEKVLALAGKYPHVYAAIGVQQKWFIRQLELAGEVKKPVIIHSREAAADTMYIMKNYAQGLDGVIHCYSY